MEKINQIAYYDWLSVKWNTKQGIDDLNWNLSLPLNSSLDCFMMNKTQVILQLLNVWIWPSKMTQK